MRARASNPILPGFYPDPSVCRVGKDYYLVDSTFAYFPGESYPIWHGALREAVWPEGPHLYKRFGRYYLLIAEGGTGHEHAVTIARGTNLKEPFVGNPCNPILTHRHLGQDYPIVNVGHSTDQYELSAGDQNGIYPGQ